MNWPRSIWKMADPTIINSKRTTTRGPADMVDRWREERGPTLPRLLMFLAYLAALMRISGTLGMLDKDI
jgi:hypothetical protein